MGLTTPPLAQNPITPNCSLRTLRALGLLALPLFCPARGGPVAPAQRAFLPFGPRGTGLPQEAAPEPCRPSWEWMWPALRRTHVPSHTQARGATYTRGRHAHTSANVHTDWLSWGASHVGTARASVPGLGAPCRGGGGHEEWVAPILSVTEVPGLSPLCIAGSVPERALRPVTGGSPAALPSRLLACEWCSSPRPHTRICAPQVPSRTGLSKVTCPRSRGEGQPTAERWEEAVRQGLGDTLQSWGCPGQNV